MGILEAEHKVFEADHQEIGSFIATKWNMPDKLNKAIGNHHPLGEAAVSGMPLLSRITILADLLSPSNFEYPEDLETVGHKMEILQGCCNSLGLGMEDIKKVYSVLPKQVLHQAEGLNLEMGDAVEYLSRMNTELFDLYVELANMFKERQELSRRLLAEERLEGTLESLHIALATLSHYINNSTMNISGQCEVLKLLHGRGDRDGIFTRIPAMTDSIKNSIKRISVVLEELANITSMEKINYFKHSKAIDIEQSLKERLESKVVQA
jgi:signal transduction histidine kinase